MERGKGEPLALPTNLELRLEGWVVLPVGSNHTARCSDRQYSGVITLDVRVICWGNERDRAESDIQVGYMAI